VGFKAVDGRLRGQRTAALWTAPNRKLHQGIMTQPIEVFSILVAAGNRRYPRHHHFEHLVSDAIGIASIRHGVRKPPAHTERAWRKADAYRNSSNTPICPVNRGPHATDAAKVQP
jgi:hypothetical protein